MTPPRVQSTGIRRHETTRSARARSAAALAVSPLARMLGIARDARLAWVDAPYEIERALEPLPAGAYCPRDSSIPLDMVVLFADTRLNLSTLCRMWAARLAPTGALWVAWPRHASTLPTDLTREIVQTVVRDAGLVGGASRELAEVWSALRFTR